MVGSDDCWVNQRHDHIRSGVDRSAAHEAALDLRRGAEVEPLRKLSNVQRIVCITQLVRAGKAHADSVLAAFHVLVRLRDTGHSANFDLVVRSEVSKALACDGHDGTALQTASIGCDRRHKEVHSEGRSRVGSRVAPRLSVHNDREGAAHRGGAHNALDRGCALRPANLCHVAPTLRANTHRGSGGIDRLGIVQPDDRQLCANGAARRRDALERRCEI